MPLIMICGIPCSGKTTRAKELEKHLLSINKKVKLISENDILEDKNEAYKNSQKEKESRGKIMSEVQREIGQDVVVIVDSTNYIKGFRYQLYCLARGVKTIHCVVYCDTPLETAKEWNQKSNDKWDEKLLTELASRMEKPNAKNRWDSPLFTVKPDESVPCKEVVDAIFARRQLRHHESVAPVVLKETNFMYELDQITNSIVNTLMANQSTSLPGDYLPVKGTNVKLRVPQRISLPELRKLRAQFIKITQIHPPSISEIARLFVTYLNDNMK